jgi:structural hemagglutinin/hemolysin toxin protein RtxA
MIRYTRLNLGGAMYKICFYSPADQAEIIKNALFAAGAGQIGNYARCAWQSVGEGQFMGLKHSDPFIGEANRLEKVTELKVELVCEEKYIHAAIDALKKNHPYETPAYQVIRVEDF